MDEQQKSHKEHVEQYLKALKIEDRSISFVHGFAVGILYSISSMEKFSSMWIMTKLWLERTAGIFLRHADDRRAAIKSAAKSYPQDGAGADASA